MSKYWVGEKSKNDNRVDLFIWHLGVPTYFQKTNPGDLRICWNRILLISDVKSMVKGLLHIGNLFPLTSVKIRIRVSQSNGINVQTGKLLLATSFSG